jgi:soluble lytic murein transglycosylase-like protein
MAAMGKNGKKGLLVAMAAAVMLLMAALPALADIYMYIDSEGVLHFTNLPTSTDYQLYIKEMPRRSDPFPDSNHYDTLIDEASRQYHVSFSLIKAIIRAESAFNPKAVSRKGALGLMQIMPQNLELLNVDDPFNPKQNIMGGSRYLKSLLERFEGKVPLALAAYNAGPAIVETYRDIPPYQETKEYVQRVMKFFHAYR